MPAAVTSFTISFINASAEDRQGSFCAGGAKKEYGYQVLAVACGASTAKSSSKKCGASERISSAEAPRPCSIIKTFGASFKLFPADVMFLLWPLFMLLMVWYLGVVIILRV